MFNRIRTNLAKSEYRCDEGRYRVGDGEVQ